MTPFTQHERETVAAGVERCRQGLTLPIAGLGDLPLYWDDETDPRKMPASAKYVWLGEDRIIISQTWRDQLLDCVPFVCHELRHRYQHEMLGRMYPVLANRIWARWTIEPSAYRVENECMRILGMETGDVK